MDEQDELDRGGRAGEESAAAFSWSGVSGTARLAWLLVLYRLTLSHLA